PRPGWDRADPRVTRPVRAMRTIRAPRATARAREAAATSRRIASARRRRAGHPAREAISRRSRNRAEPPGQGEQPMNERESDPTGAFRSGSAGLETDQPATEFERHAPRGARPGGGNSNDSRPATGRDRGDHEAPGADEPERGVIT